MRSMRVLLVVAVLLATSAGNAPGQPRASGFAWQKLEEQSSSYLTMAKDLLEMARTHRGYGTEFQVAYELYASAIAASDYLNAATDLLFMYYMISLPIDQALIRSYVNKRLNDYILLLEHLIKQVNLNLSLSVSAGISATGIRLRDELRGGQSLLKSVVIK